MANSSNFTLFCPYLEYLITSLKLNENVIVQQCYSSLHKLMRNKSLHLQINSIQLKNDKISKTNLLCT